MTNDRGQPNEPTSYGLRPPRAPGAQPVPEQGAYRSYDAYEPTQSVPEGTGGQGAAASGYGFPPQAQGASGHPAAPVPPGPPPGTPGQPPQSGQYPQSAQHPQGVRMLGERYQLVSRLGHGGMGTVWHARDLVVEREVAIKEPRLPENLSETERQTAYQRMQREARAAARIDHPSVVTMHDVVVEDGKPWVVMELVRGRSLADRLQEGTLDPREAARVGLAVVGALQAAHEAGVLHRDVKPDNVLLGRDDRVVLTDFGIAQVEGEQRLTETGAFVGSPEFISPERVLGQGPGPASDLWSLGVVLYAAVEGVSPFRRSHTPATLQAVLSAEPQTPSRAGGPLSMVIMQLLRKDPMARPSAREVRQSLEAVAYAVAAPTAQAGALTAASGSRWVPPVLQGNRKAQYGLGAGVVVVALALVMLLLDPFGGNGLPNGWENRPEREAVKASLAVPSDYEAVPADEGGSVTFYDPSAVFTVYLERVDNADLDPDLDDIIQPTRTAWVKYYEDGGEDGEEIKNQKVSGKDAKYHGKPAFETLVEYENYNDTDDDPYRFCKQQLVVPKGGGSKVYWRLQIDMPAEGWARPIGDRLFRDVVAHLDIEGM